MKTTRNVFYVVLLLIILSCGGPSYYLKVDSKLTNESITAMLKGGGTSLILLIQNNSADTIRVNLNKTAFVLPNGNVSQFILEGEKYSECGAIEHQPFNLPKGTKVERVIYPCDYLSQASHSDYGWSCPGLDRSLIGEGWCAREICLSDKSIYRIELSYQIGDEEKTDTLTSICIPEEK